MYEVTIKISANIKEYWASLEFTDEKNKVHRKELHETRQATSKQSNALEAMIAALKVLKTPCMVSIYSDEDYITAAFQNGWINDWANHEWKNKKGREIRNAEQWQQAWELIKPHPRRVIKCREA